MHKIGLKILLVWVLFLPITAYSLGLGDINVKSFLNQPLRADISIISARPGEIDDLLVGLANRKAFARASLARPSHLSQLKFKVIKSEDGSSAVISVKTQSAVKEPVLSFLVEADWSKGKVFREFTILLDPPYFAQQVAPQTKPVAAATASPLQNNTVANVSPKPASQPAPIVNQEPVNEAYTNSGYVNESATQDNYQYNNPTSESTPYTDDVSTSEPQNTQNSSSTINVVDGATLWSIAKSIKSDNATMSQVMLALQRLNQDAFGKNNINNLKQGAVLRVPTEQNITDLSQRDAYAEVLSQNGLWNDYLASVGYASADASNTQTDNDATSINAAEKNNEESSLSILADGEGDSDKAALRSDEDLREISNLRKQLLLSEEEAESAKVERDELLSRVKMLEEELAKRDELQNLVTIQDDNLATMEQNLAANNDEVAQLPDSPAIVEEPVVDEMMQSEEVENNDASDFVITDNTITDDALTDVTEDEVVESMAEVDEVVMTDESTQMTDEVDVNTVEEATVDVNTVEEATVTTVPAPIIVSESSSSSSSMVDDIVNAVMSNPIVQGGLAVILLLVLLAVKFFKGKQSKEQDNNSGSIEDEISEDPIDTQSGIIIPNVDDEDETPINVPQMEENQPAEDFASTMTGIHGDDEDEDEFSKTAVISADDMANIEAEGSDLDNDSAESPVEEDQDETLDEVDVYLAYSLFENAEELLKEKITEFPNRADYRAKLLDTYFATQNTEAFIDEASSLKDLGDSASQYWPKVQTMGFELDPNNAMFAGGEGGDIGDLTFAKPEVADFDIGADAAATSDFDLSLDGDDTNFDLSEDSDDVPDLEIKADEAKSDNSVIDLDDLPDDLGDFDLDDENDNSVDFEETSAINIEETVAIDRDDGLEFNLDEELVVEDENKEKSDQIETDDDLDFILGEDESLEISLDDVEPDLVLDVDDATTAMDAVDMSLDAHDDLVIEDSNLLDTDDNLELDVDELDNVEINIADESDALEGDNIDLDETSIMEAVDLADETSIIEAVDLADETSIIEAVDLADETSIMEAVDLAEETSVIDSLGEPSDNTEIVQSLQDEDSELVEIDLPDDELNLNFDEEDITDIGSIEGLMLPDDVDEVATKLDLAKAFQDMGDAEGARSSLEEVLEDGNEEQKAEAQALLKTLS